MTSISDLLRRLRRSPKLRPVRRNAVFSVLMLSFVARRKKRGTAARVLRLTALAGFVATYLRSRRLGQAMTDEHVRRMRRLRPEVLEHFYTHFISSMEEELKDFPPYDRHKHEQRYELLARLAIEATPEGGTVVDVGSASGLVLDRIHAVRNTKGIGFDLSSHGVRQRAEKPDPPVMAQAVVEHIPLRDGVADTVVFSEVIEHLIDASAGMAEVSRIMKPGGTLVLTTNNGSEMPEVSPLYDPLTWVERLLGRWWPQVLAFRNLTWHDPINDPSDPLPPDAPTYAPHFHSSFVELRDLGRNAGLEVVAAGSFEFPAPQSAAAGWLRRLVDVDRRLGLAVADGFENIVGAVPGLSLMGTHNLVVYRKVAVTAHQPGQWWLANLVDGHGASPDAGGRGPSDYLGTAERIAQSPLNRKAGRSTAK